jgi:hypothetical protein
MENIRHRHGIWVGGSLSHAGFFFLWEKQKNFVGSGVKIRVSRVTGNQQLFLFGLICSAVESKDQNKTYFAVTVTVTCLSDPPCTK